MGKNNSKLFNKNRGIPIPSNPLETVLKDKLTPDELKALPRGWQILGEVILVHIPPALQGKKALVADGLLRLYPRCRTVLETRRIAGEYRQPIVEKLAGDRTETLHKENYVVYKLDAARVMFSQGNFYERRRMGTVGKNERVVDMFAGIGYFTLPMAVHSRPEKILAIELNPLSYGYLCENIALNKVEGIVEPILGDCREKTPVGWADRVIMGYVGKTQEYLPWGIRALKPGGILHYHETTPDRLVFERPIQNVKEAAKEQGRSAEILNTIKVKKYSPGVWHVVIDARLS
ncbi:class I SAM-dependent methyltransferase [Methanocella conradii]|uniref:class I SAM-dependent methyltransferase n=1 Tax=Methanocella conradii TaxID=1175444 RepID=UPI00157D8868|nr:class I SAM-dependent methyltransferase family protein [Methanocella conradii]